MVSQTRTTEPRVKLGRVHAYLGKCEAAAVRLHRQLFGGVTLQGHGGLKIAQLLHEADDLSGVDLDPATYLPPGRSKEPNPQFTLDLDLAPVDWVRIQRELGMPVIRTPGRRIRVSEHETLRTELDTAYPVPVSVVLALDGGWLGHRHIDFLADQLRSADRDVSLVFAAPFDPLDSRTRVTGLQRLVRWSAESGRKLEILRTDLVGLHSITEGACLAAIGLLTSTRHLGLPLRPKERDEYEERQRSPLVFVPRLLHWQRGRTLRGLRPWQGDGVTDCACPPCTNAGTDLMRFAEVYPASVPTEVITAVREHESHALSELVRSIMSAPVPATELARRRREARYLTTSVKTVRKVSLDEPAWLTNWR